MIVEHLNEEEENHKRRFNLFSYKCQVQMPKACLVLRNKVKMLKAISLLS